jgi:hypothetical protein
MRYYVKESLRVDKLEKVTCSMCGKNMCNITEPECISGIPIDATFGYGSKFDGNEIHLDLCDECIEDIVRDCNYNTGTVPWLPDDKDDKDMPEDFDFDDDHGPCDPKDEFGK